MISLRSRLGGISTLFMATVLVASCSRPVPFTPYLAERLLQENLSSLAEPPLFELSKVEILSIEAGENTGTAVADIVLKFPVGLGELAEQQQLATDSAQYSQYKNSFGEFVAGEVQRHHARYGFIKRGKRWMISASQPLSAPDIIKP